MVQAMDQAAIEGAMDDATGGSWSDGWCKRYVASNGSFAIECCKLGYSTYVEIPFYRKSRQKKKELGCYTRKRVCLSVFLQ